MNAALVPLHRTLELNTRLLLNALDGVDDELALKRPGESTNHIAFISCHLVESRHYLAGCAGCDTESPFKQLENARRLEDVSHFPAVEEIRAAWSDIGGILGDRLPRLGETDLEAAVKYAFPIEGGESLLGCITFLVGHEAFHIGQIALLRRHFGLAALKY